MVISKPLFPSQFNIIHINGKIFNFFSSLLPGPHSLLVCTYIFQALVLYLYVLYISSCVAKHYKRTFGINVQGSISLLMHEMTDDGESTNGGDHTQRMRSYIRINVWLFTTHECNQFQSPLILVRVHAGT